MYQQGPRAASAKKEKKLTGRASEGKTGEKWGLKSRVCSALSLEKSQVGLALTFYCFGFYHLDFPKNCKLTPGL